MQDTAAHIEALFRASLITYREALAMAAEAGVTLRFTWTKPKFH